MKSLVVKHSVVIAGHKTSVSLEDAFWKSLKEIATERKMTFTDLVTTIDGKREHDNLSSSLRLFVLDFYQSQLPVRVDGQGQRSASTSSPAKPASATTAP